MARAAVFRVERRRTRVLLTTVGVLLAILQSTLLAGVLAELLFHLVPFGLIHTDFLAFYAASDLVRLQQPQLIYDGPAVALIQKHLVGQTLAAPFLNPPFVAAALAPLSALPLHSSRVAWFVVNVTLAAPLFFAMTSSLPRWQRLGFVLLFMSTFPMYQSLVEGQLSIVMLAGSYGAFLAMRRRRWTIAGIALSVLWIKPQFAVVVLVGLVLFRYWRTAASMLVTTAGICVVTLPLIGISPYFRYPVFLFQTLLDHLGAQGPGQVWSGNLTIAQGLNGLMVGWFGSGLGTDFVAFVMIIVTVGVFLAAARRVKPGLAPGQPRQLLIAGLCVGLLVDPHLYGQDLLMVLLIVPIVLAGSRLPAYGPWGLCVLLDAPMIDAVFPIHIFTIALWIAVTGLCAHILLTTEPRDRSTAPRGPSLEGANELQAHALE